MSQPRKLHLFNCDRTYKLDAVEGLLNGMKVKLGFESVEKHHFSLSQMSEMSTKTIPELQIDMAFFVVHAHESRLSINEDNAGIGYAKIYNALLKATGGNVIIVIGGDDNYKNEDEEDRVIISRWARRKISSQFNEECLDGRKSFIFSWNKKHREIHEEALLHYFDPSKKGQKFEYQPKPKPNQAGNEPSAHRRPLQKAESMYEQRTVDRNPLQRAKSVTEQRTADSLFSPVNSAEQRTACSLFSPLNSTEPRREDSRSGASISTARANMAPSDSQQGARPKEVPSSSTGTKLKELAVLGCNVSDDSMQAVTKVLKDIAPKLNLSESPPVENLPPEEAKRYLTRNKLKFCVLVVDAETIKDAYENLPKQKVDYEELLETAADKVVAKVIILLCGTCLLSTKDETSVNETIERIIYKRGKGFTAWLKNGRLTVDPDVLVRFLISASPAPQRNPQTRLSGDVKTSTNIASGSVTDPYSTYSDQPQGYQMETNRGWNKHNYMQQPQGAVTSQPVPVPPVIGLQCVMLKSKLRDGVISYQPGDVQIQCPGFEVPDYIIETLLHAHANTPDAGVTITNDNNGILRWSVDPKTKKHSKDEVLQIAANETLMWKTRVRYGKVSYTEDDVEFVHPLNWQIPPYIIQSLERDYCHTPNGELFIISDEKGNARFKVNIGGMNRMLSFANKQLNRH